MRLICGLIQRAVLVVLLLTAAACGTPTQREPNLALFDGASLSGWHSEGEAQWEIADGVIEASGGGDGFLVSAQRYANYRLQLEFWIDASTNSGVFIGCQSAQQIDPERCYEINIWDQHPNPPMRTGAIVLHVMPPLAQVDSVGKWNRYEIESRDGRITARLNGVTTAVLDQARTEAGYIALQHFGTGTVRFRDVRLMKKLR